MQRTLLFFSIGLVTLSSGCATLFHLDEYSTADESASPSQPGAEGGSTTDAGASDALFEAGPACTTNKECNSVPVLGGEGVVPAPSVCLQATGHCAPLTSADCPSVRGDYLDDHAIVIGTLLRSADATLEEAAVLAAEEIDAARGATRPLVVVSCTADGDVTRAAQHLAVELRVPAIVGPTAAEDVVGVTQQVTTKAGTLVVTPTSVASAISKLADNDLTWRVIPSDTQRAKLVIAQLNDLENVLRTTRSLTTVKLGVVHRTDALGTSARDAISDKLILNGRFIGDAANAANVSIDSYTPQPGVAGALAGIVSKYAGTFRPDLVFVTAPEQITELVVPLEAALTAARVTDKPYYVCTDAAKTQAFLDAIDAAQLPGDIRRRVRGVGVRPDTASSAVLDAFTAAYAKRYGRAPAAFPAALSYDAMYAIAYALVAAGDAAPNGASVAKGLRALGVGDAFAVGAEPIAGVLEKLAAGKSVTLRATGSLMQWDSSGDLAGGTAEVWCIGAAAPSAFGGAGLTMDVQTQVVGGAFVQCR